MPHWPKRTNVWQTKTKPARGAKRPTEAVCTLVSSPTDRGAAPQMAAKQPARPHHPHTGWYLPHPLCRGEPK
jgi:hypothetical protein